MRIAVVTPWFGETLAGGAERLAWELATGLRDRGRDVTVFTTCAASFHAPWNVDAHAPGESDIGGMRLVRFPVDRTDPQRFREVNRKLLAAPRERLWPGAPLLDERELNDFVAQNVNSTRLLSHLARHAGDFDALFFLPYLYGIVLRGWRVAPQRAVVVPCLHDEPYAYLAPVAQMMRGAARLLFNGVGALELARRLYGPGILPRAQASGCGITAPAEVDEADRSPISGFVPEDSRYVLYLGRRSEEKNVHLLVEAFARYRAYRPESNLTLVLAGPDDARALAKNERTIVLPYVTERAKARLLRNALALAQPSTNESFSRAMMEAWSVGRPVAVHAGCIATATALEETQAGWKARDMVDWIDVLARVDAGTPEELTARGAPGREYVARYAAWPRVLDTYEATVEAMIAARSRAFDGARRIVHFLEKAQYADSTTLLALQNDALLRRNGYRSSVVAIERDRRLGTLVADPDTLRYQDVRIDYVRGDGESPSPCMLTGAGLPRLRGAGDAVQIFPIFVDAESWNLEPSPEVMAPLRDGRTNILAVGAIDAPNRQLEIGLIFRWYYTLDFDARLLLVGSERDPGYLELLRAAIREMGLEHRILITGEVSRPALAAFYQSAHLFVSLRRTYETGLGLLEAMAFDVPVCAAGCEQSREVLAAAGILVAGHAEPLELASLWRVLVSDEQTRRKVIAGQRRRLAEMREDDALHALTAAGNAKAGG